MGEIQAGEKLRHYKGGVYEIVACGCHTETLEEMVVYKSLSASEDFPEGNVWIRPRSMFEEFVHHEGGEKKRFQILD